ncbi:MULTISPECIES: hypothetical protein [unclassified Herbaspirillum]|uniref:hypothetical protein n=1 Tax=unclassified Herbaspirillum TaxID=2624150 RepID=UPI00383BEC94
MKITTAMRVHRILKALKNYEHAQPQVDELTCPSRISNLGALLGYYRNSNIEEDVVAIFDQGLTWNDNGNLIVLRFIDVIDVELTDGKNSESLLLKMKGSQTVDLPIKGRHERCYDSLEVLRFLRRVMTDAKHQNPLCIQ